MKLVKSFFITLMLFLAVIVVFLLFFGVFLVMLKFPLSIPIFVIILFFGLVWKSIYDDYEGL